MTEYIFEQHYAQTISNLPIEIFSITGAAGTGKSSLLAKTYDFYTLLSTKLDNSFSAINPLIVAPTGRAVKSAKERSGLSNIKTIHQALEFPDPDNLRGGMPYKPKRDRFMPLDCNVIFIDEISMVGWTLFDQLLDALRPGSLIRPYGDLNQLKPVEDDPENKNRPSPFQWLLNKHSSVTLNHIWRNGSNIYDNADRILKGFMPENNDDWVNIIEDDVLGTLDEWVKISLDMGIDYIHSTEAQIITPAVSSEFNTEVINDFFVKKMRENEPLGWFDLPRSKFDNSSPMFKVGMKIIQTKNDYNIGVMNGETGIIQSYSQNQNLEIDFGDRIVVYPKVNSSEENYKLRFPQMNIKPGIAITTHKSQGSQYDHVIYTMKGNTNGLLGRSNFYTGVSRTKLTCSVISDKLALEKSLRYE